MAVLLDCCVEKLQNQNIDCKVITYLHFNHQTFIEAFD